MDEQVERRRILIDTSVLIDHLRRKRKDKTLFFELAQNYHCLILAITQFEFWVGSTLQNREYTEKLLALLPVLPFNAACAEVAADIYHILKARNQLIPLPDIFIAATAIENDLPFQTLDRKHFERIKNLRLDIKMS